MDPRMRYCDLNFALEWSKTAKERIKEDTPYELEEAIKLAHGYLSSYCKSINLEGK